VRLSLGQQQVLTPSVVLLPQCNISRNDATGYFYTGVGTNHRLWRFRRAFPFAEWNLAMMIKTGVALALSLACISAAESPANYRTYSGTQIEQDPVLLAHYERTAQKCSWEASTPPRGNLDTTTLHYNAALRACLYRQGYYDRGGNAYPATLIFDHFFDR
jgi:hypothetical protein